VVRVVAISDTHTYHDSLSLPHGDILIHAGDFTFKGREAEVRAFGRWFRAQPHKHKIVISGNHDLSFESEKHKEAIHWLYNDYIDDSFHYLQDTSVTVEVGDRKIKVYGSPWQPEFCAWAFNVRRGPKLAAIWKLIPEHRHPYHTRSSSGDTRYV
jgi:3',5'-cyclic AMP phosphodiesterase CpdA